MKILIILTVLSILEIIMLRVMLHYKLIPAESAYLGKRATRAKK